MSDRIKSSSLCHMSMLDQSWNRCWGNLGNTHCGDTLKQELVRLYEQRHRKYHTIQHLTECIKHLEENYTSIKNPEEVEIALWFHDAIYDINSDDNEEKSAEFATERLSEAQIAKDKISRINNLILATQHSYIPKHFNEMLIVDIDLTILGSPRLRFIEYERQIREEYQSVPIERFKIHRQSLLNSFLDRETIYNTQHFKSKFEKQARKNLQYSVSNILSLPVSKNE